MPRTILYHAHCTDGFGAAWAAWRLYGNGAIYRPVEHGLPPPEIPSDHEVVLLDFCYSRDEIVAMKEQHRDLLVIDHHRTAEKELEGLPYGVFDNEKSAAVLAWERFHPNEPVPRVLQYVMDRDLWLWKLPESRAVFAALSSYPMDFELWNHLDVDELAKEGVPILRYQSEVVSSLCEQARYEDLAGYRVPVVNAVAVVSELGETLLKRHPEAPFVAIYFDRGDGIRQWSLRSREDFDVSEVARLFENGGHRQAAGFESELPRPFVPEPKKKRPA